MPTCMCGKACSMVSSTMPMCPNRARRMMSWCVSSTVTSVGRRSGRGEFAVDAQGGRKRRFCGVGCSFGARLVPFGTALEIDRSMSRLADAGRIAPAIVGGIASTATRFVDYAPALILDRLPDAARGVIEASWGGAARSRAYAELVIEDVEPLIDAHFPTCAHADATFLGGSSLGAVAALETLARYPDRVAGAACLSAHLSLLPVTETELLTADFAADATRAVGAFARDCLPPAGRHAVWIDRGALGIDRFYGPTHAAIGSALHGLGYVDGVDLATHLYPGVGHDEAAWRARLDDALPFLLGHAERACRAARATVSCGRRGALRAAARAPTPRTAPPAPSARRTRCARCARRRPASRRKSAASTRRSAAST